MDTYRKLPLSGGSSQEYCVLPAATTDAAERAVATSWVVYLSADPAAADGAECRAPFLKKTMTIQAPWIKEGRKQVRCLGVDRRYMLALVLSMTASVSLEGKQVHGPAWSCLCEFLGKRQHIPTVKTSKNRSLEMRFVRSPVLLKCNSAAARAGVAARRGAIALRTLRTFVPPSLTSLIGSDLFPLCIQVHILSR